MSLGSDHFGSRCARRQQSIDRFVIAVKREMKSVFSDLWTTLLAGFCLAGLAIVASTFDGDLQGSDEVIAAILGTLSLFAILAALELADRLKERRCKR